LPTCQYEYESDYPSKIRFACNEPSRTNKKFCIFHDKDHYGEYEHEAAERFEQKVKESIDHDKPLECFGYYLPEINFAKLLKRKRFAQPVYFNEATFYKEATFSRATFTKGGDFAGATFFGGATFYRATFTEAAIFQAATFTEGLAGFSEATFTKGADFAGATFSKVANFSGATFLEKAYFSVRQI
jgi:uncharacterized protein YjbI with pentapeptide repeats